MLYRTASILCLVAFSLAARGKALATAVRLHITETSLGIVPGTSVVILPGTRKITNRRQLIVSPDLRHLAQVSVQDGKECLVIDGVPGKLYDDVYPGFNELFSPDSNHVAYGARSGNVAMVVHDGIEGPKWPSSTVSEIVFSPDSRRLGYVVDNDHFRVVVDGMASPPYQIESGFATHPFPVFSADSKHYAYRAQLHDKQFMVLDGVEGKRYAFVLWPVFSDDGRHLAYMALHRNDHLRRDFVVVDGIEGKSYQAVDKIQFPPNGKHVVYVAVDDLGIQYVVVDGKEGRGYDHIWYPVYSRDGQRVSYAAMRGDKILVVVDGKEFQEYDGSFACQFSPNGKRIGFIARRGGKEFLVVNGHEKSPHDNVLWYGFSPNSKRVAYVAMRGQFPRDGLCGLIPAVAEQPANAFMMVIDNKRQPEYESIRRFSFSPNSRRLAYAATQNGKQFVVVDGKEGKRYDDLLAGPMFTSDSKHVVYLAKREKHCIPVVDGVEGNEYDEVVASDSPFAQPDYLRLEGPNSVRFIGIRKLEAFRVEVRLESVNAD